MALKDMLKSLAGKKEISEQKRKNEIANALMSSENFPIIRSEKMDMSRYRKIPLMGIAALGAAFSSLPEAARTITKTVTMNVSTNETLFVGINPKGIDGFLRANQSGTVGNIMQVNEQGKQVIAGRMRFKPLEGGLPVSQTTMTEIPFDPMTLVVAVALISINQKLDALHAKAEEILQFLKLDKQSKQRGNLNMLSEIMDEYKQNCDDEKMCALRFIAAQSVKKDAYQDIVFYQERIARQIQEQKVIHSVQKAQGLLDSVTAEFYEYQLACYLYAFASFMEVMLQKNFETVATVTQKLEACARKYTELYTACHAQIAAYQRTAIETQLLGGLGNVAKNVGKKLSNIPVLSKGPVDEALINAGEALGKHNQGAVAKKLERFAPFEDSQMGAFIENVRKLDLLYNHPDGMITDGENVYILESA